jgi:hypothetical protein
MSGEQASPAPRDMKKPTKQLKLSTETVRKLVVTLPSSALVAVAGGGGSWYTCQHVR